MLASFCKAALTASICVCTHIVNAHTDGKSTQTELTYTTDWPSLHHALYKALLNRQLTTPPTSPPATPFTRPKRTKRTNIIGSVSSSNDISFQELYCPPPQSQLLPGRDPAQRWASHTQQWLCVTSLNGTPVKPGSCHCISTGTVCAAVMQHVQVQHSHASCYMFA